MAPWGGGCLLSFSQLQRQCVLSGAGAGKGIIDILSAPVPPLKSLPCLNRVATAELPDISLKVE